MTTATSAWSPKTVAASFSGLSCRRLSPLTVLLIASALVYAGLLLKRMIHVQAINRHKRSVSEDTGSFAGSSFLGMLSFGGEKKDPTTDEVFSPQSLPAKALESPDREKTLEDLVPLYIITPTYPRPEQLAELTRLSQTLMNVRNMVWLVVEDAYKLTKQVEELLHRIKPVVPNYHLLGPMPDMYRKTKDEYHLPKGVSNRNKGLEWILKFALDDGVVYFADDDNTYDLRLFYEIRKTKRVSIFPVGLVSGAPVSTPIVENGEFNGFYVGWDGNRKFPVDMAGFAFSVRHFKELSSLKKVSMPYIRGYEEDGFVKQLDVTRQELEILVPDRILVWHTKTAKMAFKPFKKITRKEYTNSNLGPLNAYWCMFIGNFRCEDDAKAPVNSPVNNNNNNNNPNAKKKSGFKIV